MASSLSNAVLLPNILAPRSHQSYSRELPRRFREDIVNAASKESSPLLSSASTGLVCAEGIEHVLSNIGEGDKLTHDEIETILREVGGPNNAGSDGCVISASKMLDLISNRIL